MRGFKDHSLHLLILNEMLGLELSNFSKQLKLKSGIDDDHQVIVGKSNDLRFIAIEFHGEERPKRQYAKETKDHLEAIVLRTKSGANKWLHLTPRIAALRMDAFERGAAIITKIHAYLVEELNLVANEGEKLAQSIDSMF